MLIRINPETAELVTFPISDQREAGVFAFRHAGNFYWYLMDTSGEIKAYWSDPEGYSWEATERH